MCSPRASRELAQGHPLAAELEKATSKSRVPSAPKARVEGTDVPV